MTACKVCGLDYLDCAREDPRGEDPCPGMWSVCICGGRVRYCGYHGEHAAWEIKQLRESLAWALDNLDAESMGAFKEKVIAARAIVAPDSTDSRPSDQHSDVTQKCQHMDMPFNGLKCIKCGQITDVLEITRKIPAVKIVTEWTATVTV